MKRKRLGLLAISALGGFMLFGLIGNADELAPGAKLPSVTAKDPDGRAVDLAAAGGKGWTLVYFFPKADTPGCTKQACSLRDAYATLTDKGVTVFGVSSDDEAAQKAFQTKYKPPVWCRPRTDPPSPPSSPASRRSPPPPPGRRRRRCPSWSAAHVLQFR